MARCPARWPSSTRRLLDAQPNLWTHTTITVGRSANETNRQIESALVEVHHQNFLLSLVQSKAYSIAIRRALFSAIAFPLHCRVIIIALPWYYRTVPDVTGNAIVTLECSCEECILRYTPIRQCSLNALQWTLRIASEGTLRIECFTLKASDWTLQIETRTATLSIAQCRGTARKSTGKFNYFSGDFSDFGIQFLC